MDFQFIIVLVIGVAAIWYFVRYFRKETLADNCDGNCGNCPFIHDDGGTETTVSNCTTMKSEFTEKSTLTKARKLQ